mgnify:CR=1 FL=1
MHLLATERLSDWLFLHVESSSVFHEIIFIGIAKVYFRRQKKESVEADS